MKKGKTAMLPNLFVHKHLHLLQIFICINQIRWQHLSIKSKTSDNIYIYIYVCVCVCVCVYVLINK